MSKVLEPAFETARSSPLFQIILSVLMRRKAVIYGFFASRLALLAVGLMTQIFIEPLSAKVSPLRLTESPVLRMWGQWDTGWYMSVAAQGYSHLPGPDGQVNWVFFPAFPMLSVGLAQITGLPLFPAMLLLSNLSFLAALFLAHRFASEEFDERTADLTVALICAAPGSYVFSSAYTESLFLLALSACLLLLRARRWIAAGGAAAVAVLTRNVGVGLSLPFVMMAAPRLWGLWRAAAEGAAARRRLERYAFRASAGLILPVLALAAFCLLLYRVAGDPFAFVTAQAAWGRSLNNPITRALIPLLTGELLDGDVVNYAACWLSLSMVVALALMRRWPLFVLACFMTLLPLASGLTSYARYCLVVLPLFLAGAKLLSTRPAAAAAVLISFATLNGFLMVAWTLGMWVTV